MDAVAQAFVIVAFGLAVLTVAVRTGFRLAKISRSLDDRVARLCRDGDVNNAADAAADEDTNGFPLAW
jgi:hypothetical protein